ncbi:mannitol dehydrogenase family protein [Corynebacterium lowii]|uniref:Mannitol-1-phosphate 5-dehydrogenase n=1 Tax=Corynebacterium lowii TaxID=1544413 RepID=A0A0Q0YJ00_9CORY|nr:mannitol dehydrogenase family protein [Corynebacterium lowii]KQB86745.1 Polyol:NADP oxidoreductase [Corynebacterium lowii]MDP9851431.1 mannitol 2-dehydrogenase [Corynebacterium lowii]
MPHLSTSLLESLSDQVAVPTYDRSAITPGIVHFGVGGFHRAHQARYLDELMNAGKALDFGIVGMGVMPSDAHMRDALASQDYLYTLVEKAPDGGQSARVIGSIIDYVFAPDDPRAAVARLVDPAIRLVSLTVTEGGYDLEANPYVASDIEALREERWENLRTFFGLITAALIARRRSEQRPFTVMSCDNIQGNGDMAREMFLRFAADISPDLAAWIGEHVPFPNSMVDRITPETTEADREEVASRYSYTDAWPVVCEDFTQWVLEDSFVDGRPAYEEAGVQVVEDVVPFELMKLRLLNASHQGLCYFGYLAGHRLVHDVVHDERFARFLLAYMEQEATPSLRPLPGVDLDAYRHRLIDRFGNAAVKDTVARLCAESSDRIPKWLLPVIRENIAAGRPVALSAAIVASWARYAEGVDEQGQPITVVDRLAEPLGEHASRNREDSLAFLRYREVFGDLIEESAFTEPYVAALNSLHERGALATVEGLIS